MRSVSILNETAFAIHCFYDYCFSDLYVSKQISMNGNGGKTNQGGSFTSEK